MIGLLALRNLVLRPWRSVFLLFGYSLGVAVMIVLLSIGEALLAQARDERLVGSSPKPVNCSPLAESPAHPFMFTTVLL